jgi:hypothetical protein
LLNYAPVTSCDVKEIPFSLQTFYQKRWSMTPENMEKDPNCVLCMKKSTIVPEDCKQSVCKTFVMVHILMNPHIYYVRGFVT